MGNLKIKLEIINTETDKVMGNASINVDAVEYALKLHNFNILTDIYNVLMEEVENKRKWNIDL